MQLQPIRTRKMPKTRSLNSLLKESTLDEKKSASIPDARGLHLLVSVRWFKGTEP